MQLFIIIGFTFVSVSLLIFYLLQNMAGRSAPAGRRLKEIESRSGNPDMQQLDGEPANSTLAKALDKIALLRKAEEQYDSNLKLSLMQAGFYHENSARIFASLKLVIPLGMFLVYSILGLISGNPMGSVLFIGALMALAGYIVPTFFLRAMVARRQNSIALGLPDALDFLVICIEAGLGLNAALIRVGQELQLRCKALGQELLRVNQEMRTGIPREQALRNLASRNPIKDLKALIGAVVLSDRLGTNLADTLRTQSDFLRTRVLQNAEEKAAKAGIKLLFPLVLLIMPALLIVILGPGVVMLVKNLLPVLQQ